MAASRVFTAAKRFLLHRVTVLALILAIISCILLALLVPAEPIEWDAGSLEHYLSLDGFDHIVTTWPFAALLVAFLASLLLSTWDQFGAAWRRTFAPETRAGEHPVAGSTDEALDRIVRTAGYRPVGRDTEVATYARHPWAHWGSFLLHGGLALSLALFLVYVLTERQGVLRLQEGEQVGPGAPWFVETRGLLARPFELPVSVRLDRVVTSHRRDDSLRALSAELTLLRAGKEVLHVVAPNDSHYHLGYRIYQTGASGHAFELEVSAGQGGTRSVVLHLPLPRDRATAGYGSFMLEPFPAQLKAKYHLAADRGSMEDGDPLLVMRLVEGQNVIAELPLRVGGSGRLGQVDVKLVAVRRWTDLLFDAGTGMTPVLSGFFAMILGALLIYAAVPRAVTIRRTAQGHALGWRAFTREEGLYRHEFEAILARCAKGTEP